MSESEMALKLDRARREVERTRPHLTWCWCCRRHTGSIRCRYKADLCARCKAPKGVRL